MCNCKFRCKKSRFVQDFRRWDAVNRSVHKHRQRVTKTEFLQPGLFFDYCEGNGASFAFLTMFDQKD